MRALPLLLLGLGCLVVAADPISAQKADDEAKAILDKAIKAHGGEKALAAAKAAHMKGKGTVSIMEMKLPFTAEIYSQIPDKFKAIIAFDIMNMNFEVIQCWDGKKGWTSMMGQVADLPADKVDEMKQQIYTENITNLLPLKEKGYKLSTVGEVKVEGKAALGLRVSKEGKKDVTLYFDKTSHHLVKAEYPAKDPTGSMDVTQEKFFSNYKALPSGYQNPMKMVIRNDGALFLDIDVTDVQLSERHDDSIFARP